MCLCVHGCVEARGHSSGVVPQEPSLPWLLRKGLLVVRSLLRRPGWPASEPQGSACLRLPGAVPMPPQATFNVGSSSSSSPSPPHWPPPPISFSASFFFSGSLAGFHRIVQAALTSLGSRNPPFSASQSIQDIRYTVTVTAMDLSFFIWMKKGVNQMVPKCFLTPSF